MTAWSTVGDGSIGSPSAHIRSFQLSQSSLSACRSMASPLARVSADCAARMLVIARALPSSLFEGLAVASGEGRGVVFRRHPDIQDLDSEPARAGDYSNEGQQPSSSWRPVRWRAGIVQQALADVLPDRVRTVEADGIGLLDFDGPAAAAAADPQYMLGNFRQPQRAVRRGRPA